MEIHVAVGSREIAGVVVTVEPDTSQVVGAAVREIMEALGQAGYYASDGDLGQELREQGAKKARNLFVELRAVKLAP